MPIVSLRNERVQISHKRDLENREMSDMGISEGEELSNFNIIRDDRLSF